MNIQPTNLPRVTYSNTGEDFSGVHAHLDEAIPEAEARLLGKHRPALIGGRDRSDGEAVAAASPIVRPAFSTWPTARVISSGANTVPP